MNSKAMKTQVHRPANRFRILTVLLVVTLVSAGLMLRGFDLHVTSQKFLQGQGDARAIRPVTVAAHRGMIVDRNGEPLAVSTPVDTVWADPRKFRASSTQLKQLAKLLELKPGKIKTSLAEKQKQNKEFAFIKRRINPSLAQKVMDLNISGVSLRREYRRYYPAGEVTSHLIGFTDVDDVGQEGTELAYNEWLRGEEGNQLVMIDSHGRAVKHVDLIKRPRPGKDLVLSVDRRLQYLTYRELKRAVFKHKAKSGSAVVLDVQTGEVLAMVNQPSFNPNNRTSMKGYRYRNRVVTDTFEPGSTIKPFTVAAALATGRFTPGTYINTAPGYMRIGKNTVRDIRNYGRINITQIIEKSSNVGASKIALMIKPKHLLAMHQNIGFGDLTGSGLPGEATGTLHSPRVWRDIERATLSYGYGLSVTTLQLARAYSVLAADGQLKPVSLELQTSVVQGEQVLPARYARQVRNMMKGVVSDTGTGKKARVPGYQVAGKTGTVKKVGANGYSDHKYVSLFVGMAPADSPRLVMAVTVHEPRGEDYYGGEVAAPVFANVMAGALRLLGVDPDELPAKGMTFARWEGRQ